jgi:hypothetical protein
MNEGKKEQGGRGAVFLHFKSVERVSSSFSSQYSLVPDREILG